MNSWTISGRLGRDAEITHLPSGDRVCRFSVALYDYKSPKETLWVGVTLWGKLTSSNLVKYLTKGTKVGLVGRLSVNENEKKGIVRSFLNLNVHEVELLSKPKNSEAIQTPEESTSVSRDVDTVFDVPF